MTTTIPMSREEFFRRLRISRQRYYVLRTDGVMPDPPRIGGKHLAYTEEYLQRCRRALDEAHRLDVARRRMTRRKLKELSDAGVL